MAFMVDIKVVPQSGRQQFKLNKEDRLVCYLKSAPERNQANNELIKLLSKTLKIPMVDVVITAGKTSRNKRVKIELDVTYEQLLERLGIHTQMKLF
ncbi:MAG: DUF167 domain-containing protein [Candidatus Dependentiae bacterium]